MLVAAGAGADLITSGAPDRSHSLSAGVAERVDPARMGGQVVQMQRADGRLWVLSCVRACLGPSPGRSREQLVDISDSGAVVRRFRLSEPDADAFAITAHGFWVAHFRSGVVSGFSARTGRQIVSIQLRLPKPIVARDRSFLPLELTSAGGYVWASGARGRLAKIDPRSGRLVGMAAVPDDATSTASRYGSWEAAELSGIGLLGPHRMRLRVRPIMQGDYPLDVAMVLSSGRFVWALAYTYDASTTRTIILVINPRTGRAIHRVPVARAAGVVAAGHTLYVGDLTRGRVYAVSSGGVLRTLDVARHNAWLEAASPGQLWAANRGRAGGLISLPLPGA